MKKIYTLFFTGSLLMLSTASCNLIFSQTSPLTPAPAVELTETATVAPTATVTVSVPMASATPEFAPFCEAGAASVLPSVQCQALIAEESSTFCSEKDPYNLILFDENLTYEVLTQGFRCSDAGRKNDRQMIACTGQMASQFVVQVCDPACVVPTVQAKITQCPQGYNYDSHQGCCTQEIQLLNQNCRAFKFKTTTCVSNCAKIVKKSQCLKNSYACVWDEGEKACKMRE
jgi:hypothetical protein